MLPEDNPTVGNEPADDGAQVSPADGGPIAGQSGTPDPVATLSKQVADLTAELRGLQGRQDKQGKAMKEHEAVLAEYKGLIAKGLTPEQAETAMGQTREQQSVEGRLAKMQESLDFLATKAGIAVTNPDVAAMVTKYALDPNSPEVARVLATGKQGDSLRAELADLALQKTSRPAPSAAAAPAIIGSPAPVADEAKLLSDYTREMVAARGKPAELRSIKARFKAQGLPVEKVVINY